MSRIGKLPVTIPQGVTIDIAGGVLTAKGKLGSLKMPLNTEVDYDQVTDVRGMDIIIVTTAHTDAEAKALLKGFDMPFVN